jgi:hypothetical protein
MFTPQELQEIQLFLALLYPWSDPDKDLYKTISWTFVGKDGVGHLANYTAQSMPDLIRLIETRTKRAGANVYLSLSTQLLADTTVLSTDGYAKAIRRHDNLVSFKSIALDIDVGKKDGYATTQDAFDALDDFIAKVGLPEPTMIILSGSGGLHVYWCFNDPVPLAQWKPLATALRDAGLGYGLKFDPQVTVNPVGILRVPNTYNHKTTPPNKVTMYHEEGETFPRYGYQQMLGMLGAYTNTAHLRQGTGANHERTKNFTEGVSEQSPPVSIDDVAANCLVIEDILERGGNGDAEPLWNMALYAAAFTTDPFGAAHRLSDKDPRYTRDGTDKKLLEKINARAANSAAGWPKCEQFSALHPGCATCPLFAYKKSPFNHARRAEKVSPQEFMPAAGNDELMPKGYWRNKEGHVCGTITPPKAPPFPAVIIDYPILDAGIDGQTGDLIYRARIGGVEVWRDLTVSANTQPASMAGAIAKGNGLYINPKNYNAARDFFVAWTSYLQTIKRSAGSHTFGWTGDGKGFVFDDKLYTSDKTDIVHRGKHADPSFKVAGELKPWQNAMQLVYGNMPLEATVATAFAAPLVELVGSSSLVVSIYSPLSGIGKTTAMMLAQSVWGHPRTGMSSLQDTNNSVMKKIADLKSLPVYWDELKTKDQLDQIVEIVFQVTQGKGKARLTRDITQAEAPSFTTMFVVASNLGIADSVYAQTESTEAGGLRVFEIVAQQLANPLANHKAGQLLLPIQANYGHAGAAYAEWLARNKALAVQVLSAVSDSMEARHKFSPKERYWRLTMETILVGATLANHCGLTQFDIPGLSSFLDTTLRSMRADMKQQEHTTMATSLDIKGLLQEMISDLRGSGNLIITEIIPTVGAGKPPKVGLVYPPFLADLLRLGDVWAQLGQKDGRIRIRRRPFDAWFRDRRINTKTIVEGLKQHYMVLPSKTTIGAGVDGLDATSRIGQTACYDFIPLLPSPGSDEPS